MARSNGSTNEGISVSPVYSTPKNHESRWCQQPCVVYQLDPDVFQLPVDSKRCILTRVEWAFKTYSESYQSLPHANMQKYTPAWSLEDQDMVHLSWGMSEISFLSYWRHKVMWWSGIFITGNRQGSVDSTYLVGPTAVGRTKPFSSMGLLPLS